MNGLSVIRAAIGICLLIAAVDGANAKGTFRLQGPWPSSYTQKKSIQNGPEWCRHLHHVLLRNHQHQVCAGELHL